MGFKLCSSDLKFDYKGHHTFSLEKISELFYKTNPKLLGSDIGRYFLVIATHLEKSSSYIAEDIVYYQMHWPWKKIAYDTFILVFGIRPIFSSVNTNRFTKRR